MKQSIAQVITAGIFALAKMQAPDGSFPLWTGTKRWVPCGSLFATSYIMMGAGRFLPSDNKARAVRYIRSQRRSDGLWEYDPAIRIPPDVDSSACSLAALTIHGDGSDLAGGADLLRAFWRPCDGPFRTWKADGAWSSPQRDDPVVNCNVLFALGLLGSAATATERSAVINLLEHAAKGSRYYCSPATLAHAAHRAGLDQVELPAAATARPDMHDLMGSLRWLCGMRNTDAELEEAVLRAQRPDGSWPIVPWVTGAGNPKPYWGSPAITTSLALEALNRGPNRS